MILKFNRTKIGANENGLTDVSAVIKTKSKFTARISADFDATGVLKSRSKMTSSFTKVQYVSSTTRTESEQTSEYTRVRYASSKAKSKTKAKANYKAYEVKTVTLTNVGFEPKDIIEIDFKNYNVTKNNENILDTFSGDFFELSTGTNVIVYEDDISVRKVFAQCTHTNQYL